MTRRNRRNAALRVRALPANLARRAAAPGQRPYPPERLDTPALTFHVSSLDLATGEILAGRRARGGGS